MWTCCLPPWPLVVAPPERAHALCQQPHDVDQLRLLTAVLVQPGKGSESGRSTEGESVQRVLSRGLPGTKVRKHNGSFLERFGNAPCINAGRRSMRLGERIGYWGPR